MGSADVINQWFLAGTAMALVPIIIHLVQRRRIRKVVFSSVRFLRTMSRRVVRRRRLTELLLILLRTLALAALALAFARPFFRERPRGSCSPFLRSARSRPRRGKPLRPSSLPGAARTSRWCWRRPTGTWPIGPRIDARSS